MAHKGLQTHAPTQTIRPTQSFPRQTATASTGAIAGGILFGVGQDVARAVRATARGLKRFAFGGGIRTVIKRAGVLGAGVAAFDIVRQIEKQELSAQDILKRQLSPQRGIEVGAFAVNPLFAAAGKFTGLTERGVSEAISSPFVQGSTEVVKGVVTGTTDIVKILLVRVLHYRHQLLSQEQVFH